MDRSYTQCKSLNADRHLQECLHLFFIAPRNRSLRTSRERLHLALKYCPGRVCFCLPSDTFYRGYQPRDLHLSCVMSKGLQLFQYATLGHLNIDIVRHYFTIPIRFVVKHTFMKQNISVLTHKTLCYNSIEHLVLIRSQEIHCSSWNSIFS